MTMLESFTASAQYDDWIGTTAADNADRMHLSEYLIDNNLMNTSEFLIAASLSSGNHGVPSNFISAHAYLYSGGNNFDAVKAELDATEDPIPVRIVELKLTIEEFIVLFKRFNIMLTHGKLNLNGRTWCGPT